MTSPDDRADREPELESSGNPEGQATQESSPASEAEILRNELLELQERLEVARKASDDFKDKFLRSRAELDNYRRRMAAELDRARLAGQDAALQTVMTVFDDLQRALDMAAEENASQIVPGVTAVLANLERDMASQGIERIGLPGEHFDPDLHEALSTLPTGGEHQAGTIAQVFQAGFTSGDRLIRPARVMVYND
jgi:molecular chaperone GrpE